MSAQKKSKRRFGGGRQPRTHVKTTPIRDRAIACPCCKQAFVILDPDPPGAYRLKDAAHYIGGVSVVTFRRLVQRGLIRPNRAVRHLLFPRSELDRFLTDNLSQ